MKKTVFIINRALTDAITITEYELVTQTSQSISYIQQDALGNDVEVKCATPPGINLTGSHGFLGYAFTRKESIRLRKAYIEYQNIIRATSSILKSISI